MSEQFTNKASTTLNGAIDNSQTSITVTSATGFPTSGDFRIIIPAEGGNTDEILTVTGVSGTTWTVTRASEAIAGTQSASAHSNGASVVHVLTAGALQTLLSPASVWSMVKDGSSQTLTNAAENTITWEAAGEDDGESVIDLANERFVIPTTGRYLVTFVWAWESTTPAQWTINLLVNGSAVWPLTRREASATSSFGSAVLVAPLKLNAGNLITVQVNPGAVTGVTARGNASAHLRTTIALVRMDASADTHGAWTTFVPTLSASPTPPTVGNGTLTGRYKKLDGKTYIIEWYWAFGSTSNAGSGGYTLSLPSGLTSTAGRTQSIHGYVLDNGTAYFVAGGLLLASAGSFTPIVADGTGSRQVTHNVPMTWANNDSMGFTGIIEVA